MSEIKLISPLLDNIDMGDPISERCGVRACPAMSRDTDDKYIVKIVSTPASPAQLEALLLSGAYPSKEAAVTYFKELSDSIIAEAQTLQKLSALDGFVGFEGWQSEPMDDGSGYDVYLLSTYRKSLERILSGSSMTHLGALNLGLDLCTALSVSRRSGYLYADLKPSNIYKTGENSFKIGDIGFLKLSSLKYASMPERYRSAYTAPEIQDAYSALNTTLDIYAVGIILYQVFNGGQLPAVGEDGTLPPPDYADYEMAEIILKACAQAPEDRWQDPVELGHALVSYMQRNGAHDTPIIPQAIPVDPTPDAQVPEAELDGAEAAVSEESGSGEMPAEALEQSNTFTEHLSDDPAGTPEPQTDAEADAEDLHQDTKSNPSGSEEPASDVTDPPVLESPADEKSPETPEVARSAPLAEGSTEVEADSIYTDDGFGNLTFLDDIQNDETLPGEGEEDVDYDQISAEVTSILTQADALIAHPTPDPVVQPQPIDVPIPPPIAEETTQDDASDECDAPPTDPDAVDSESSATEVPDNAPASDREADINEDTNDAAPTKPKSHWLRNTFLVIALLALIAGGFIFYKYYYLQTIDSLELTGTDDSLTVSVSSELIDADLEVVCADTYGNKQIRPLVNGQATFTDLAPNTAYTVRVEINGFHHLVGQTTAAYATPKRTNIAQFNALTGAEDGSVILSFIIEGRDCDQWKVTYSAPGEDEKEISFSGHMYTLNGLTIGSEYTFELLPAEQISFTGTNSVTHTASKLVRAKNLSIDSCMNGKLEASWETPDDASVSSWTVHCYNENGYDQTVVISENSVVFEGITDTDAYTVEVTAAGMSVGERVYAAENSVTVTDFAVTAQNYNGLTISWTVGGSASSDGWKLQYTVDDNAVQEIPLEDVTSVEITPYIPGGVYSFSLLTGNGDGVLGGKLNYTAEAAAAFSDYGAHADEMHFNMCRSPGYAGWDRYDLSDSDYTTSFSAGENASFLVRLSGEYGISSDEILILYVIRDASGKLVSSDVQTAEWSSLWYRNYGEFDIPSLPAAPGNYTISVYFNGAFAGQESFTVTES